MADISEQPNSTFPRFQPSHNTKRSIIGPMYESEDEETEYSFVHPYDDKRCHIKSRSVLERLANNLNDTLNYGHAVGLHASTKFQKFIEEDYESDSSNERITRSKTLNLIVDKAAVCAGGCAANLKVVADELIESDPCGALAPNRGGGDSYRREEHRQKVPIQVVHKKSSEARAHNGVLKDDITVTSGEFYSSDEDSYDSSSGSESWSSDAESSYESERRSYTREAKLRRKQQFLRRRAMERAAAEESDSDEEEVREHEYDNNRSSKYGDKFIYHHTQEMRPKLVKSTSDTTPLIENNNDEGTIASDNEKIDSSSQDSPTTDEGVMDEAVVADYKHFVLRQLSWESKKATIVITSDQARDFLTSSHIGPVVTKLTCSALAEVLQLGDVIIRLNGDDVSTLDGLFVAELLKKMEGKSICVTYLRKTMQV